MRAHISLLVYLFKKKIRISLESGDLIESRHLTINCVVIKFGLPRFEKYGTLHNRSKYIERESKKNL